MTKIQLKSKNTKECKGKHEGSFLFSIIFFVSFFSFLFVYLKKPTGLTLNTDTASGTEAYDTLLMSMDR